MKFIEKELNGFSKLFNCAWNVDKDAIFKFIRGDIVVFAKVDCFFETDNGLELDEPDYEEYNAIAFENIETHELFEINYNNLPAEIYCNNEKIL